MAAHVNVRREGPATRTNVQRSVLICNRSFLLLNGDSDFFYPCSGTTEKRAQAKIRTLSIIRHPWGNSALQHRAAFRTNTLQTCSPTLLHMPLRIHGYRAWHPKEVDGVKFPYLVRIYLGVPRIAIISRRNAEDCGGAWSECRAG